MTKIPEIFLRESYRDSPWNASFGGTGTGFNILGGNMQPVVGYHAQANAVGIDSAGDILIAGTRENDNNDIGFLAEYSSSGVLVSTFGSLGIVSTPMIQGDNASWNAISVLSDGDILVAGYETAANGHEVIAVAEYSSDAHLVKSFGTDGTAFIDAGQYAQANAMAVESDGKILLTGSSSFVYVTYDGNGNPIDHWGQALMLAQLTSTGQADSSFGVNGVATILQDTSIAYTGTGLLLPSSSSLVVTGTVNNSNGYPSQIFVSEYELSPQTSIYGYDVKNKLISYNDGTTTATYVYDDAGNRVAETVTTGGTSTTSFYLTDTENPTGYAQPLEVWASNDDNPADATLQITYILGDRILGQVDSSGNVSYLLVDGHGSTQQMTDSSGNVTATFSYDAFGTALNFNAATAGTQILFGGDAIYDPASGLYMHGDGIRDTLGFLFIQMDPTQGKSSDPISLHKYLLDDANPINFIDPSGYNAWDLLEDALGINYESGVPLLSHQVQDWQAYGWNVAADMLNHFLTGNGSSYSLPASDITEVENDPAFQSALENAISSQYPASQNSGPTVVNNKYQAVFHPWNGQLFMAFHDLQVTYRGTIQWVTTTGLLGIPTTTLHYNLQISIWKNYNFNFDSHSFLDYMVPEFSAAYDVQHSNQGQSFDLDTTWHMSK